MSLTRLSRVQMSRMIGTVRSLEQLSIKISSNEQFVSSICEVTALQMPSAFSSSLRQGMMTEISGREVGLSTNSAPFTRRIRREAAGTFGHLLRKRDVLEAVRREHAAVLVVIACIFVYTVAADGRPLDLNVAEILRNSLGDLLHFQAFAAGGEAKDAHFVVKQGCKDERHKLADCHV